MSVLETELLKLNAVLLQMNAEASERNVLGVSEVTSLALIHALAELSGYDLYPMKELALTELLTRMIEGTFVSAMFPILMQVRGRISRPPDERRAGDGGTHYGAFAAGKLFQSLRTGSNSTSQDTRRGESPARGAIYNPLIIAAFSGGTEDDDERIATVGVQHYLSLNSMK